MNRFLPIIIALCLVTGAVAGTTTSYPDNNSPSDSTIFAPVYDATKPKGLKDGGVSITTLKTVFGSNAAFVAYTSVDRAKQSDLTAHTGNTSNPHSVTAAQAGAPTLAAFTNYTTGMGNYTRILKPSSIVSSGGISATQFVSTAATGTAPLTVASTTTVANLGADTLDGYHASQSPGTYTIPVTNIAGDLVLTGARVNYLGAFKVNDFGGTPRSFGTIQPDGYLHIGDAAIPAQIDATTLFARLGGVTYTVYHSGNSAAVSAGSWTPTLSSTVNTDAVSASICQYTRVGDRVSFAGVINVDPTTASSTASVQLSLPVASNFSASTDAAGVLAAANVSGESGALYADTSADTLVIAFRAVGTTLHSLYFSGMYQVK